MTSDFNIRKVEETDKEEVIEMTSKIWDGRDYIPDYFDRWIEEGGFICGTLDGEIVALAKHTWHGDDILWLEGLRVHPDYHEEGYGRKMIEGQLDFIEDLDYRAARFLTSDDNTPVKKVVEDAGFKLKNKYDYLRLKKKDFKDVDTSSQESDLEVGLENNVKEVSDLVLTSQELEDNSGLYIEHWIAYPLTEDLIRDRIEKERCYSAKDEESGDIDSIIFLEVEENYDSLSAAFACGTMKGLTELFRSGTELCWKKDYNRFRLKTSSKKVIKAAQNVGFSYSDRYRYNLVYEYKKD